MQYFIVNSTTKVNQTIYIYLWKNHINSRGAREQRILCTVHAFLKSCLDFSSRKKIRRLDFLLNIRPSFVGMRLYWSVRTQMHGRKASFLGCRDLFSFFLTAKRTISRSKTLLSLSLNSVFNRRELVLSGSKSLFVGMFRWTRSFSVRNMVQKGP